MRNMKEFYQAKYRDSLFVVKAGGRLIADDDARRQLLSDIKELTEAGIKVLLVYGGGNAIDEGLAEVGIEPRKIEGRRVTGPNEMKVVKRVMGGDLAYRIASTIAEIGLYGLTLSTLPPSWLDIYPVPRDNDDDFGYDGRINSADAEKVLAAFTGVPFISVPCQSATAKDGININADNVAVALAVGTKSRKLIFLSDVDGVLIDGKTAPFLTDNDIPGLIADGTVTGGMQVKLENCCDALNKGVNRIHLLDGFRPNALLSEVYDSVGPATMVIREEDRQSYLNEIKAENVIKETMIG